MSQEKFLQKIRGALPQALLPEAGPAHPGSFQGDSLPAGLPLEQLVANFKQELEALAGHVHILEHIEQVAAQILEICSQHKASQILAWGDESPGLPGLNQALIEAGISVVTPKIPASATERESQLAKLDPIQVGLTGAQGGLADTGTVALISGPGRGRLASLLPPVHIVLLSKRRLYPSLPAFLAGSPTAATTGSNLVFIAGPSRTGDIEMTLSMGVHGPGEIHAIIIP